MNEYHLSLTAGRTFEHAIKDAIKQRSAVVMTANLPVTVRGPQLEMAGIGPTLPDMQMFGVRRGWVEVKAKGRPNSHRNWQRDEHGIDKSKWLHYLSVERTSEMPVYLLICEVSTGVLLMQSLSTLQSTGKPRMGDFNGTPCINFDRRAFVEIGQIDIPQGDMRRLSVSINWPVFNSYMTQAVLLDEYSGEHE